jgi:hypothetical protein
VFVRDAPQIVGILRPLTRHERGQGARRCGDELPRPISHVLEHDRHDDPTNVFERRATSAVFTHRLRIAMPINAVVLHGDACFGPREIHAAQLAISLDDFELQFRYRQSTIDHRQPRLSLHGRFRSAIRDGNQVSNRDDPAPTSLFDGGPPQVGPTAGTAAQCSVERRQHPGTT